MASNKKLTNNTNVKIEPGASTQRLPSLKPPRDLSLSAFKLTLSGNTSQPPKKKIYVPNFNVQRNRPQENASAPVVKQESNTESNSKPNHGTSPRGRGRGRGRGSRTFIQTTSGLFSGGVESNFKGRGSRDRSDGAREKLELQKPKLNLKNATPLDKSEEDTAMKDLLRDDFVDDPSLDPDYDNCPIKLPLSQTSKFFIKDETSVKDDSTKIKTEPLEFSDQNIKVSSQNVVTINGEMKQIKEEKPEIEGEINGLETKISSTSLKSDDQKINSTCESNIIDLISSAKEDRFFQLQLPNSMPSFSTATQSRVDNSSQANDSESNTTEQTNKKGQTLRDLPAGKVGKIQIMKSGRTRLVLGNTKMWLEPATQVAFNQELVGLELDRASHSGKAKCLGSVALRMMVCPDWDWLVSQTS